jgi:hypothetical protein
MNSYRSTAWYSRRGSAARSAGTHKIVRNFRADAITLAEASAKPFIHAA